MVAHPVWPDAAFTKLCRDEFGTDPSELRNPLPPIEMYFFLRKAFGALTSYGDEARVQLPAAIPRSALG